MQNKMIDLQNHLFAELERLGDEELAGEELKMEIERSRAITGVAKQVISNASLALKAETLRKEYGSVKEFAIPKMLE